MFRRLSGRLSSLRRRSSNDTQARSDTPASLDADFNIDAESIASTSSPFALTDRTHSSNNRSSYYTRSSCLTEFTQESTGEDDCCHHCGQTLPYRRDHDPEGWSLSSGSLIADTSRASGSVWPHSLGSSPAYQSLARRPSLLDKVKIGLRQFKRRISLSIHGHAAFKERASLTPADQDFHLRSQQAATSERASGPFHFELSSDDFCECEDCRYRYYLETRCPLAIKRDQVLRCRSSRARKRQRRRGRMHRAARSP